MSTDPQPGAAPALAPLPAGFTCGFCGLLCDDLSVSLEQSPPALSAACVRAERGLADWARGRAIAEPHRVDGQPADFPSALAAAARLLARAKRPCIDGLATDVAGARAAVRLADRLGARLAHLNGAALRRNLLALQSRGGFATTFAEVRNRADLVVLVGTDAVGGFPRFFERLTGGPAGVAYGQPTPRRLVFLGTPPAPQALATGHVVEAYPCARDALPQVVAALRAITARRPLRGEAIGGIPLANLRDLASRFAQARYAVLVWAAAELDFAHADLLAESLHEWVKSLNVAGRCAALPLAGSDGDLSAQQVVTWQTGYPLPLDLAGGVPRHEPLLDAAREADLRLWISGFDPARAAPGDGIPTIALAHPALSATTTAQVFIATGVPGLDHAGQLFRADGVVALPLRAQVAGALPSAAQVLDRLLEMQC